MLKTGLGRYLSPEQLERLAAVRVGLAGAGGLGSNCALLLARSGVERFLILDGDTVDASNLNRQQFLPRHVGMPKVTALAEQLRELNPAARVDARALWLDAAGLPALLPEADIWMEALDRPEMKRLFVEEALRAGVFVVSASGLAGCGGAPMQRRKLGARLVLVGDFSSDVADSPPLAPRVVQAAALQADAVLEHILGAL